MKTPEYWEVAETANHYERFPTKGAALKFVRQWRLPQSSITRGPNKRKEHPFNPGSVDDVGKRLKLTGWVPSEFTETGKPKITDDILKAIGTPEALMLAEYVLINDRIGQLATGKQALMSCSKNGRIHGQVNTNGAVTGRCCHYKPNINLPKVTSPFGCEFRDLVTADEGWVLVGADAAGLELRMLGHFLARFDNGEFANEVVNGDIHTRNQKIYGYPEGKKGRDDGKTTTYAVTYGAGDFKVGSITGVTQEEIEFYRKNKAGWSGVVKRLEKDDKPYDDRIIAIYLKGAEIKRRLKAGIPAYEALCDTIRIVSSPPGLKGLSRWKIKGIEEAADRLRTKGFPVPIPQGFLRGLDGRRLHVRSEHAALNTLLQSAGALVVKLATVLFHRHCQKLGWVWGRDYAQILHAHDEMANTCRKEIAEEMAPLFPQSVKEAGETFGLRVPLDGSSAIGKTWKDIH